MARIWDGDILESNGFRFRVNIEADDTQGAPWECEDGHGPVTGWVSRNKGPGERILNSERGGAHRFYDMQGATRQAWSEGWGLGADDIVTLSARLKRDAKPGDIVAEAVERDFQRLRAWCNGGWQYVGVIVTHLPDDDSDDDSDNVATDYRYALWGIESDSSDYLEEVARELIAEAVTNVTDEDSEVEHWANQNLITANA
jgi:hypothetical protein